MTLGARLVLWHILALAIYTSAQSWRDSDCGVSPFCEDCVALNNRNLSCGFYGYVGRSSRNTTQVFYRCVAGDENGPFNASYPLRDGYSSFQFGYCCASITHAKVCNDCVNAATPGCAFSARKGDTGVACYDKLAAKTFGWGSDVCDGCYARGPDCDNCLADPSCSYCQYSKVCIPTSTGNSVCPEAHGRDCNCSYTSCDTCQAGGACLWKDCGGLGYWCHQREDAYQPLENPTCAANFSVGCGNYSSCATCLTPQCQWCEALAAPSWPLVDQGLCTARGASCPAFVVTVNGVGRKTAQRYPQLDCNPPCSSANGSCLKCTGKGQCGWCEESGTCQQHASASCWQANEITVSPDSCPVPDKCPTDISCVACNLLPACRYCHQRGRCQRHFEPCSQYQTCQDHCSHYGSSVEACTPCNADSQCEYCADYALGTSNSRCLSKPAPGAPSTCAAPYLALGAICNMGCAQPMQCGTCVKYPTRCAYCGSTGDCVRFLPGTQISVEECPGNHTLIGGLVSPCTVPSMCDAAQGACSTCIATSACMYSLSSEQCVPLNPAVLDPHNANNKWGIDCTALIDITVAYTSTRYMKLGDVSNFRLRLDQDTSALRLDPQEEGMRLYASARTNQPSETTHDFASDKTGVMTVKQPDGSVLSTSYYIEATCIADSCTFSLLITPTYPTISMPMDSLNATSILGLGGAVTMLLATCYVVITRLCKRRRARASFEAGARANGAGRNGGRNGGEEFSGRRIYRATLPPPKRRKGRPLVLDGGHGVRQAVIIIGPSDLDFIDAVRDVDGDNDTTTSPTLTPSNSAGIPTAGGLSMFRFPSVVASADGSGVVGLSRQDSTPPLSREVSMLSRDDSFGAPDSPSSRRPLLQESPPRSPSMQSLKNAAASGGSSPAKTLAAANATSVAAALQAAKARRDAERTRRAEVVATLEQLWLAVVTPEEVVHYSSGHGTYSMERDNDFDEGPTITSTTGMVGSGASTGLGSSLTETRTGAPRASGIVVRGGSETPPAPSSPVGQSADTPLISLPAGDDEERESRLDISDDETRCS